MSRKKKKSRPTKNAGQRREDSRKNDPAGSPLPLDVIKAMDDGQTSQLLDRLQQSLAAMLTEAADGETIVDFTQSLSEADIGEFLLNTAPQDDDLRQAQALVAEIWEEEDPDLQFALAQEALEISPDCADAWNFLADYTESAQEAMRCYEQAEQAARRVLADDFEDFKGDFWGYLPTRPFMRALQGKAIIHEELRENDQAIAIYREMLELNPNDNQGVRWRLLGLLLLTKQHPQAQALIDEYPDDVYALWPYSRLLLAFIESRTESELASLLDRAYASNKHVISYLLGEKAVPETLPAYFSPGDESEAIGALPALLPVWKTTAGATAWLRKAAAQQDLEIVVDQPDAASQRQQLREAAAVPQDTAVVWQVDYCKIAAEGEQFWSALAVDPASGLPRHEELFDEKPQPAEVFGFVVDAIVNPDQGGPGLRPGMIHFAKKTLAKSLTKRLGKLSIECDVSELDCLEEVRNFVQRIAAKPLDQPEADPSELETTEDMVWQLGSVQVPQAIEEDGVRFRPWATLVIDRKSGLVWQVDVSTEIPDAEYLCELLRKSIFCSPAEQPLKPATVQVRSHDERATLQPPLAAWGIHCEVSATFDEFDEAVASFQAHMNPIDLPNLADVPDITTRDLEYFYESAAAFYRQAPWVNTRSDGVFQISSTDSDFCVYGVIMGQMGSIFGLAIYTSLDDIQSLYNEWSSDQTGGPPPSSGRNWSILFGEREEITVEDADAIDVNGWPIASPEAFPMAIQVIDSAPAPPSHQREVHLLSHCLAAFAQASYPITSRQRVILKSDDDQGPRNLEVELTPVDVE